MSALRAVQGRSIATFKPTQCIARPNIKRVRCVKSLASMKAYVKGVPNENKLGDCPFCHRVLLTLETKQVPYEREYIDFAAKPQWLVEKMGGKVPVINEGDTWMADSDKITEWLEEKYPEPSMHSEVPPEIGGKLFPAFRGLLFAKDDSEAAAKQAELDEELSKIETYLSTHVSTLALMPRPLLPLLLLVLSAGALRLMASRRGVIAAVVAAWAGNKLFEPGPFFGGNKLNATDAAVAPKLYHAKVALKEMKGLDVMKPYPAIQKYMAALADLPAWQATDYGEEMIVKGWKNH